MIKNKVCIIAEAGINHNGNINLAYKMIDVAKEAGVDYIKFQTYITENDTTRNCAKAKYQINNKVEENQFDLIKKLELSFESFILLKKYCEKIGVGFLTSPFDLDSLAFVNTLNLPYLKIASSEVTNYPLLKEIGKLKTPVILSTGMCNLEEIEEAINILERFGTTNIYLLHCTTQYPTEFEDVNLKAMDTLKKEFNLPVGYSDHTLGIEVPIAAVAMGATIIEKHFTLDKNMIGPDHKASLEPDELKQMVQSIRNIEQALGDGVKEPKESEIPNIQVARKSIVAKCDIKKGEKFSEENLTTKRPATGISPMKWDEVIGSVAKRNYEEDEVI